MVERDGRKPREGGTKWGTSRRRIQRWIVVSRPGSEPTVRATLRYFAEEDDGFELAKFVRKLAPQAGLEPATLQNLCASRRDFGVRQFGRPAEDDPACGGSANKRLYNQYGLHTPTCRAAEKGCWLRRTTWMP
jgi:hypothetical protein